MSPGIFIPGSLSVSDSAGVRIRLQLDAEQEPDHASLRLYRDPVSNASYRGLALRKTGDNLYETEQTPSTPAPPPSIRRTTTRPQRPPIIRAVTSCRSLPPPATP
ncbi:MAG: hypothetical protein U5N26_02110 [Candidatus Marinimicrobia bacterium]|nr:hypothetical protein [Candidatus Neomarinimicrobiota bacterium]